jgi:predicted DNA-binding transcriptional regulator YafY
MRADRLLSLLMLLQARGRLTAHALAEELEVSERTIYRDVEALAQSGVPVYAERGPGGGVALLECYRTTLTGLTDPELRALFMLSIPAPLADLGLGHDLRAALLKLTAALPSARREHETRTRQRIYLDPDGWAQPETTALSLLPALYRAVWEDRRVWLTRRYPPFVGGTYTRRVDAYGLVAKAGAWFFGAGVAGQARIIPVAELGDARVDAVQMDPVQAGYLRAVFGARIDAALAEAAPPDAEGWRTLTLTFASLEEARGYILSFGCAAEVIAPEALRLSVIDFAAQITAFYEKQRQEAGGKQARDSVEAAGV